MILAELSASDAFNYANKASIIVVLFVILYGGYKKWWVWGWSYKDMCERFERMEDEKNAWRETALKGKDIAMDAFRELYERRR